MGTILLATHTDPLRGMRCINVYGDLDAATLPVLESELRDAEDADVPVALDLAGIRTAAPETGPALRRVHRAAAAPGGRHRLVIERCSAAVVPLLPAAGQAVGMPPVTARTSPET